MGMRRETALLLGAVGLLLLAQHATSIPRVDLGRQILTVGATQRQAARQLQPSTSSISPSDSDLPGATGAAGGRAQKGGQKKKKRSWWKGSSKTATKEPEYKGPAGAKQAKFDDKAAEEVINKMKLAGLDLGKKLGLKRSKLPDVGLIEFAGHLLSSRPGTF
eukprot:SAG31_NODE_735_length_12488_cov_7.086044_2_plen_162_part_00